MAFILETGGLAALQYIIPGIIFFCDPQHAFQTLDRDRHGMYSHIINLTFFDGKILVQGADGFADKRIALDLNWYFHLFFLSCRILILSNWEDNWLFDCFDCMEMYAIITVTENLNFTRNSYDFNQLLWLFLEQMYLELLSGNCRMELRVF